MITKNQIKLIKSLSLKKNRDKHNLFIAEGPKIVDELLKSEITLKTLYSTSENYTSIDRSIMINSMELKKISNFKSPNNVLALFEIPNAKKIDFKSNIIALDEIKDPGNFGTIIRLCDWFGIKDIICSENSVDCYNPKVIQSSMGSISRVNISYMSFDDVFSKNLNLVASDIKGTNINEYKFNKNQVIFFGNESNGLSQKVLSEVRNKITIPRYTEKIESLNLASSVSIVLSEIKKKITEM